MSQIVSLLEIDNLKVEFATSQGNIRAVDGVSICVKQGQTIGIVGESGCGKSATALSILGLIASPTGRIVDGAIRYNGENLLAFSDAKLQKLRGNRISMIFQEPMTSLNPVFSIAAQIAEVFQIHLGLSKKQASQNAIEMLNVVGIPNAKERAHCYPHQLSGGMRQRVMIAMALALKPDLLIADEPTTALDVTTQSQIMNLLQKLQHEIGMSLLLITHDLGLVAETCEEVVVMYAGVVVESAPADLLFAHPKHPYTNGLLGSVPTSDRRTRLKTIDGLVPNLMYLPNGCRFQDRCSKKVDACTRTEPPLVKIGPNHSLRCFNPSGQEV